MQKVNEITNDILRMMPLDYIIVCKMPDYQSIKSARSLISQMKRELSCDFITREVPKGSLSLQVIKTKIKE